MLITLSCLYVLIPLDSLNKESTPDEVTYIKVFLYGVCWLDMALFFCTGYYSAEEHKVVMNPKQVMKRYLLTYFIFDFVSSQPINLYLKFSKTENELLYNLKAIPLIKIVRLPTYFKYMNKLYQVLFLV